MTTQQYIIWIALPIAGYLLGSVPFAWLIARAHGIDLRQAGSKNIGASNLARVLGTKYFFHAFILDAGKGFLPVLAAALLVRYWNTSQGFAHALITHSLSVVDALTGQPPPQFIPPFPSWAPLLTAIACVLGHLFPLWLKFRGGKGVATGFGVVLGFWPLFTIAGILSMIVFVTTLMLYRYISVSSMSGAASFTLFVAFLGNWKNDYLPTYTPWNELLPLLIAAAALSLLIILKHRGNIARLIAGTEVTVGHRESTAKSPPPPPPPTPPTRNDPPPLRV